MASLSMLSGPMRKAMYLTAGAVGYALRPFIGDWDAGQDQDRWPAQDDHTADRSHRGAGISDLPPAVEDAQQESLPPRGSRKPGVHA